MLLKQRPLGPFQYLDCLWAQIQKLKKDRWQERHILRPYIAFDSVLCEALQHNLPPFTPPGHMPDAQYLMPRVVFRMFDYTDAPEVCWRLLKAALAQSKTSWLLLTVRLCRDPSCPAAILWRGSSSKRTCSASSKPTGRRGRHGKSGSSPALRLAPAWLNVCFSSLQRRSVTQLSREKQDPAQLSHRGGSLLPDPVSSPGRQK